MSAITETEPGGVMICILDFSARPRETPTHENPGPRRSFRVGERVIYLSHFYRAEPDDNPVGVMAVFHPLDTDLKIPYAATQYYFVTPDCWEGLRRHFTSKLVVTDRDSLAESSRKGAYMLVELK